MTDLTDTELKQIQGALKGSGWKEIRDKINSILVERERDRALTRAAAFDDLDWLLGTGRFRQ